MLNDGNGQMCSRCVMDTTVSGARFDENVVCSYCKMYVKLEQDLP